MSKGITAPRGFIALTWKTGEPCLVNVDRIVTFYPTDALVTPEGGTTVNMADGSTWRVRENMELVTAFIVNSWRTRQ